MAYTHTTLSAAEDLLSGMLADLQGSISKVRWVSGELQLLILEALRTFSALTGIHESASDPFTVSAGTAFIDLTTALGTLRAQTLRDRDVIGPIQYSLWEPYDPIDGTGMSEMFQFSDITKAVERRRDRFLLETGCQLTRVTTPAAPVTIEPGTKSHALDVDAIAVIRAAWFDEPTGRTQVIWPSSDWATRTSLPRIEATSGTPASYQLLSRAPIEIELNPVPSNSGRLDLLTVEAGAALDPATGSGTLLGIPDDYAWVVGWGARADLLAKDGPARDYARSLFCERRYRMGVAAAVSRGIIVDAEISGRPAQLTTLERLDAGRPYWQSRLADPPVAVAAAGLNLVALADPPRSALSMQMTVRGNAPVPASAQEYLQIGKEHLGAVLGYAAHLAMFKIGGQELAATTHLADSFFLMCADYNEELKLAWEGETVDAPDEQKKAQGIRRVTGSTVGAGQ